MRTLRATCKGLRDAVDGCNRALVIGATPLPAKVTSTEHAARGACLNTLVARTPRLSALTFKDWAIRRELPRLLVPLNPLPKYPC